MSVTVSPFFQASQPPGLPRLLDVQPFPTSDLKHDEDNLTLSLLAHLSHAMLQAAGWNADVAGALVNSSSMVPLESIDLPDWGDYLKTRSFSLTETPSSQSTVTPQIFDEILESQPTRKQQGVYYTQTDLARYMAEQAILPCLWRMVKATNASLCGVKTAQKLLTQSGENYIRPASKFGTAFSLPSTISSGLVHPPQRAAWNHPADNSHGLPGEWWRDCVARRRWVETQINQLAAGNFNFPDDAISANLNLWQLTCDLLLKCPTETIALWLNTLQALHILDPACGSGAFLLAAVEVLLPLYEICLKRVSAGESRLHNFRRVAKR